MRTRVDVVLAALGLEVLRVKGDRAWCACPFHESTSDSVFFVRRAGERRGSFHCFSCKAGGALTALVMHVRGIGREEAREFIRAAGKGFEPPRRKARVVARPAELGRSRFEMPAGFVRSPLAAWPTAARRYLEERGLGEAEVDAFRIGYAVDGPLAGRVVIPFLDERGRPGTYSARTVSDEVPKYKTPHESERPVLDTVFGSHLWPPLEERRRHAVVVTEGAIDAMSVRAAAADAVNVGALNGSNIEPGHVLALAEFGLVVVATDADDPGDRAARVLASSIGRHARVERLRLPRDANAMLASRRAGERALLAATIREALRGWPRHNPGHGEHDRAPHLRES